MSGASTGALPEAEGEDENSPAVIESEYARLDMASAGAEQITVRKGRESQAPEFRGFERSMGFPVDLRSLGYKLAFAARRHRVSLYLGSIPGCVIQRISLLSSWEGREGASPEPGSSLSPPRLCHSAIDSNRGFPFAVRR